MFAGSTMTQSVRRLPRLRMPWFVAERPLNLMTADHRRGPGSGTRPSGGETPGASI
jgi:hypothetical protein